MCAPNDRRRSVAARVRRRPHPPRRRPRPGHRQPHCQRPRLRARAPAAERRWSRGPRLQPRRRRWRRLSGPYAGPKLWRPPRTGTHSSDRTADHVQVSGLVHTPRTDAGSLLSGRPQVRVLSRARLTRGYIPPEWPSGPPEVYRGVYRRERLGQIGTQERLRAHDVSIGACPPVRRTPCRCRQGPER
jgi:hypothetical protein